MPRIRTIKPEWLSSRDMRRLSAGGVAIWWILVSQADDEGRMHADVDDIANMARPWVSHDEATEQLDRMAEQRMIGRYELAGEPYIVLLNWKIHQRVDHPRPSTLPPPPSRTIRDALARGSRMIREGSRTPREASRRSAGARADRIRPDLTRPDLEHYLETKSGRESPRAGEAQGPTADGLTTEDEDARAYADRFMDHGRTPSAQDLQFLGHVPYEFDRLTREQVLDAIDDVATKHLAKSRPMPSAKYLAGKLADLQSQASDNGVRPRARDSIGGLTRISEATR